MAIGFGIASRNWWRAQIKGGLFPSFSLNFDTIGTDFTFTRNSFATRVNEFGLIETVTDLGSDLIQNGSFDELGSENITNGSFDTNSDWLLNPSSGTAEISGGKLNFNNSTSSGAQVQQYVNSYVVGKTYLITYTVSDFVQGSVRVSVGNQLGAVSNSNGTFTQYVTYLNGLNRTYIYTGNSTLSIDNISIKQVDPNDDWTKLNATISDGKGNLDGTGVTSLLYQDILTDTKTYQATFTVSNYNGLGSARAINNNGGLLYQIISNGTFTFTFTHSIASGNGNFIFSATTGAIFSIDNVSVKEVLEDDVPRIDYTGSTFDVPILGSELITSGNETADVVSIADNQNVLIQTSIVTIGKTYQIDFEIYDYVEGSIFLLRPNDLGVGSAVSANGTYTYTVVADASTSLIFRTDGVSTTLKLRGISVKEVTAYTTTDKGAFLLEPISTNNVTYSEDFSNSWTKLGTPTITDNYGTSPDGTQNSTRIQGNSSTVIYLSNAAATTNFSRSIYIKATSGSGTIQALSHNTNTNNIFNIDENWQRIDINSLTSSSGNNIVYAVDMRGASTDIFDIEIWGCQEERGIDYATSYIPTSGTTVTRAQETCVDATPTINSEEGVLYAEISALADESSFRLIEINDKTALNRVLFYYRNNDRIVFNLKINNVNVLSTTITSANVTDVHKLALLWSQDNFSAWLDGVKVTTITSGNTFAPNTLIDLDFSDPFNNLNFYGRTKDLRIYDKALTDDELINLTTI